MPQLLSTCWLCVNLTGIRCRRIEEDQIQVEPAGDHVAVDNLMRDVESTPWQHDKSAGEASNAKANVAGATRTFGLLMQGNRDASITLSSNARPLGWYPRDSGHQ